MYVVNLFLNSLSLCLHWTEILSELQYSACFILDSIHCYFKSNAHNYTALWKTWLWMVNYASECACTLHTINLQGVRLEKLLVAICMAGVVAHVCGGHLDNVQWSIISEILLKNTQNFHHRDLTWKIMTHKCKQQPRAGNVRVYPYNQCFLDCINLQIKMWKRNQASRYWTAERKESSLRWNSVTVKRKHRGTERERKGEWGQLKNRVINRSRLQRTFASVLLQVVIKALHTPFIFPTHCFWEKQQS